MSQRLVALQYLETQALFSAVYRYRGAFETSTQRQNLPGSAHHDTEAILLRGPEHPSPENWLADLKQADYPLLAMKEWQAAKNLLKRLHRSVQPPDQEAWSMGKAMIVKLKPGGHIDWHVDEGAYAERHNRFHLGLVTNPGCNLYSGAEVMHAPVGQLLFFDNRVKHSAVNMGVSPRIHLIVDFRKPEPQ